MDEEENGWVKKGFNSVMYFLNFVVTICSLLFRVFVALATVTVMGTTGVINQSPQIVSTLIIILAIGYAMFPFVKVIRGSQ